MKDSGQICIKTDAEESMQEVMDSFGLPGSLQARWTKCGKATCRCTGGEPHGPYYMYVVRLEGETVRRYIRLGVLPRMAAAVARRRRIQPSGRAMGRRLRDVRRLGDLVERAGALLREGDTDGLKALMAQVEEDGLLT